VAAIDVPADQVSASEEIGLLGMRARVPRGLLRLAVDKRLPVTVYLTGLSVGTGRRVLRIHQLGCMKTWGNSCRTCSLPDQAIREDPPAWHFWVKPTASSCAAERRGYFVGNPCR